MFKTKYNSLHFIVRQRHNFATKLSVADFCVYERLDSTDNETDSRLAHHWVNGRYPDEIGYSDIVTVFRSQGTVHLQL